MASQLLTSLLMLLAFVAVSTAARDLQQNGGINGDVIVPVDQICSLTRSPSYCKGVLNLIPGVASEDLYNIANEMLNQGGRKSEDILNDIKLDLLPNATSSAQKTHLEYCQINYNVAYYGFGLVSKMLLAEDYIGINRAATAIARLGSECEGFFRSPPSTPSPLTQTNSDFFNLVDILAAASYLLSHP